MQTLSQKHQYPADYEQLERCEMKCRLCNRNKALLKAKVGNSIMEVCLYCVMTEKLEPTEVLNVWEEKEVKALLEERNQGKSELDMPSMREERDQQDT